MGRPAPPAFLSPTAPGAVAQGGPRPGVSRPRRPSIASQPLRALRPSAAPQKEEGSFLDQFTGVPKGRTPSVDPADSSEQTLPSPSSSPRPPPAFRAFAQEGPSEQDACPSPASWTLPPPPGGSARAGTAWSPSTSCLSVSALTATETHGVHD